MDRKPLLMDRALSALALALLGMVWAVLIVPAAALAAGASVLNLVKVAELQA
jgi:hypothetical protein